MGFVVKQPVVLKAEFRNAAKALANPSAVIFYVKDPLGNQTTPTPVNDSTGVWHVTVVPTAAGQWYYRAEGSGVLEAAAETTFVVDETQFGGL